MSLVHLIANDALVCHAHNGDGTELAISVNTSEVYILTVPKTPGGKFQLKDILKEHTSLVTSLDWAPKTNRILSCSADRNAYVWTIQSDGKWKPTLVVLQINRAATCARWSPLENKFAIGSGSKLVAVCYFEEGHDWWVSKHIKKPIRSTVTCVDWHPNNSVIACGSSDFRVRVFSAYIKSVDQGSAESVWGAKASFNSLLYESQGGGGGWVHSVCFTADGNKLVWVSHNSTIFVADALAGGGAGDSGNCPAIVSCLRTEFLPLVSCVWIAPSTFVAAGHDCCPMAFSYKGVKEGIQFLHQLDVKNESKVGNKMTAMKIFQDIDRMATTDNTSSRLSTLHQNSISEIRIWKGDRSHASHITSIGRDGQLVMWDLPALCQQISDLRIS